LNTAGLEELFPMNSPEIGTGANFPNLGGAAGPRSHSSVGGGKKEDMLGAFTYGKTAGEAPIVGSLVRASALAKNMIIGITTETFVMTAMVLELSEGNAGSEVLKGT
jgi:hypothetical protein